MRRELATWILLADRHQGRLLQGTRTTQGSPHFEEVSRIDYESDPTTSERPSTRSDRFGHSFSTSGHSSHEKLQRTARTLASWLNDRFDECHAERFQVFAPPRLISALRRIVSPRLRGRLEAHAGDFNRLSPGQLAHHPRFSHLVPEKRVRSAN